MFNPQDDRVLTGNVQSTDQLDHGQHRRSASGAPAEPRTGSRKTARSDETQNVTPKNTETPSFSVTEIYAT